MAENFIANIDSPEPSFLVREFTIHAPIERVWRAISSVPEFCRWSGVTTSVHRFVPGAHVRMVSSHRGREGTVFSIQIDEVAEPHTFSWRWHPTTLEDGLDNTHDPTTLVTFSLERAEGGTWVRVSEEGFDALTEEQRAKALRQHNSDWDALTRMLRAHLGEA